MTWFWSGRQPGKVGGFEGEDASGTDAEDDGRTKVSSVSRLPKVEPRG